MIKNLKYGKQTVLALKVPWQVLASQFGGKVIELYSIIFAEISRVMEVQYTYPPHYDNRNKTNYYLKMTIKSNLSAQ